MISSLTVFSIAKDSPQSRLQTTYTILLSGVSFKWVFNRSLPPVAYLTLIDKYSITGIVYINFLASWHSLIGTFHKYWIETIDFWIFISFLILFFIIHLYFVFIYFKVTKYKRLLNIKEKNFIKQYLKLHKLNSLQDISEKDIYE